MKNYLMKNLVFGLILAFAASIPATVDGQANTQHALFGKTKLLSQNGNEIKGISVQVRFKKDSLEIGALTGGTIFKTFEYKEIKNAEYSYTKHPRWKSGLGLGATSMLFPPMLLVAIPLAFTKHRRHWLTVRTEKDYAVLKLSKSTRKILLPAFESYSSIKVEALGENK